jgi:hypothetical protein
MGRAIAMGGVAFIRLDVVSCSLWISRQVLRQSTDQRGCTFRNELDSTTRPARLGTSFDTDSVGAGRGVSGGGEKAELAAAGLPRRVLDGF